MISGAEGRGRLAGETRVAPPLVAQMLSSIVIYSTIVYYTVVRRRRKLMQTQNVSLLYLLLLRGKTTFSLVNKFSMPDKPHLFIIYFNYDN